TETGALWGGPEAAGGRGYRRNDRGGFERGLIERGEAAMNEPPSRRIEAEELRGWLRDADVNPLPSDDRIKLLAYDLTDISLRGLPPAFEPALGKAQKYGRCFLHHLRDAMAKMESVPENSATQDALRIMESASVAVERLLALFDYPVKQPSWHSQARHVALVVRAALWRPGKHYADVNENSPLCLVTTAVINAIRHGKGELAAAAVTEALRGRRGNKGTPRNGK